jgi:hypothetical protein
MNTLPPTRTERIFNAEPITEEDLKKEASPHRREISCPKCSSTMTMIKVSNRKDDYETTTYQCHGAKAGGKLCLLVMSLTDSVPFYMRPGDFDKGDAGWQAGHTQTVPQKDAEALVKAKVVAPKAAFAGVAHRPIYPGNKSTLNKVIWDLFWDDIMKDGKCKKLSLEARTVVAKGQNSKTDAALKSVTQWITERTGYAIKLQDDHYVISGKTVGGKGAAGQPFSDESYRKLHGFPI